MNIASNVTKLIGKTPIVKLNLASQMCGANIFGKCEFMNPSGSIKDRAGFYMINEALKNGKIDKNTTIIEPTSGNTGIALASICASLGLKLILTMPESMSLERRKLLKFLGAKVILTPAADGMNGSVKKAVELSNSMDNAIILQQFENKSNPKAHEVTTANELIEDCGGLIDVFVAGVGTGGTISGVGKKLKEELECVKVVAVEPKSSAVISGGKASAHKIQGIGAGFIPEILDLEVIDEIVKVDENEAIKIAKMIAKNEGLMVGISSGANVQAAMQIASSYQGKNIVTILCDTAERYLSTELFR